MTAALYATIGIPASGKSTLARALHQDGTVAGVVSSDDIRASLTGDAADCSRDREVWPIVESRTVGWLNAALPVLVDATNLIPEYRRWLLRVGREWGVKVVACRVPTDFGTALIRNAARERTVPHDVMLKMRDNWEAHCSTETLVGEGFTVVTYDLADWPVTKSGKVLTPTDLEVLAAEAEAGYDPSKFRPRHQEP